MALLWNGLVLTHVIKLNALSPVYGHGDACVVSRSAPRLDIPHSFLSGLGPASTVY